MTPYYQSTPFYSNALSHGFHPHALDIDHSLESMDHEMRRIRHSMMHGFNNAAMHFVNQANRPGSLAEHRSMQNPVEMDADGNRSLKLSFDVHNFKPEEVEVSLDTKNRCINVEAKHESTNEDDKHSVKRHYMRSYYLPESVIDDVSKLELKSTMAHGALSIEAPLPKLSSTPQIEGKQGDAVEVHQPKDIPVKRV